MFKRRRAIIACLLAGIPVGLALATFRYGEGLSYFSNNPETCVNCHIMREQYDSWAKSGHHHVAVCNDCHLPHALVSKLVAKSRNGWNHSKAFTMQDFPEPIRIGPKNAQILQENCLRCHKDFVHAITLSQPESQRPALRGVPAWIDPAAPASAAEVRGGSGDAVECVQCHKNVGHAPQRPTSKMGWIGD